MGKLIAFLVGVLAGAVLVHLASRTPVGSRVVAAVNGTTDEFLRALGDSYRARLDEAG